MDNVAGEKQVEKVIEHNHRLLTAVNEAATLLLQTGMESFDGNLLRCMKVIADVVGVDRVYIWKNHMTDGVLYCTQIYEWSEGAESQHGMDITIDIPYSDNAPGWEETLSDGKCINGIVKDMLPEVQASLTPQGIVSILVAPIFISGEFWGFVGFDDCHTSRVFAEQEETILRSAGLLFAHAYQRYEMDKHIRETSEQLEEALAKANEASRAKTDFLAKMSHEIRTPMNAIIGMTELALREKDRDAMARHIIIVKQAGKDLLSIINDILDFSKIEAGKTEIFPYDYSVESMLTDLVSIINASLAGSEIRFDVKTSSDIPHVLYGDRVKIRQAVLNILGNAVKYTRAGFISFSTSVEFVENGKVNLVFEVADSGIGIKPEDMDKLFRDFSQLDVEKNRNIEGVGLGLAITKRLVDAMGGSIDVRSQYGKGSTFTIVIPQELGKHDAQENRAQTEPAQTDERHGTTFTAPEARVLIVDDIRVNLKVAEGLFAPYDIQTDLCTGGAAAVEAVKNSLHGGHYDIVFMDHKMPGMNGVEATKCIREMAGESPYFKDLPIIALTANAVSGMREMFLENGLNDFISKPVDLVELNTMLERWIPATKKKR